MEETVKRLARVLGAKSIESAGHNAHFAVRDAQGGTLKVTVESGAQRIMAVLDDSEDVVRTTIDVAPVSHASEDPAFPGRVTLHVGRMRVRFDSAPSLAIEVVTAFSGDELSNPD